MNYKIMDAVRRSALNLVSDAVRRSALNLVSDAVRSGRFAL